MGQRHQIFVIARVNGVYRTLAVAHHHWLWGERVIGRAGMLDNLFRANVNSIDRELRRAAQLDWNNDVPEGESSGAFFPFIATALLLGTADNGHGMEGSSIYLPGIDTTPTDVPNDDGFTVFDITEPQVPRHAFFFGPQLLTAEDYSAAYGVDTPSFASPPYLGLLSRRPNVTVEAVQQLWPDFAEPGERWSCSWTDAPDNQAAPTDARPDVKTLTSSLKAMTLSKLLDEALTSAPEDSTWMSQAAVLHDFRPALRARIQQQPGLLNARATASVLGLAFEECESVDLSIFEDLGEEDLLAIMKHLGSIGSTPGQICLFLPNMRDLKASTLRQVLAAAPITSLDLGETKIKLETLLQIVDSSRLEKFLCPALFERSLDIMIPDFDGQMRYHRRSPPVTPTSAFPNGENTAFPLDQIIYIRQHHFPASPRLSTGGLKWERVLQRLGPKVTLANVPRTEQSDDAPVVLAIPVVDALLSRTAICDVVPKTIKQCLETPSEHLQRSPMAKRGRGVALAVAMAVTDRNKITHPIPGTALSEWKTAFRSTEIDPKISTPATGSKPGAWTLIVFHELASPQHVARDRNLIGPRLQPEVRYAFYTTLANGDVQIAGPDFFTTTTQKEKWAEKVRDWEVDSDINGQMTGSHRNWQRGKIVPADVAEVKSAMTVVERYNKEIEQYEASRSNTRWP